MTIIEGAIYSIKYVIICSAISIGIDSLFWGHVIYPELEVLYYNTVLNKSSNWGTQPFLWYFYSALPRACLLSLPYIVIGLFGPISNILISPFSTIKSLWSASDVNKGTENSLTRKALHSLRFIQSLTTLDPSLSLIVIPCLVFIFTYSFLPHKELRFILPAIPVINLCCACI